LAVGNLDGWSCAGGMDVGAMLCCGGVQVMAGGAGVDDSSVVGSVGCGGDYSVV